MSALSDRRHTRTGPPGIDPALLDRPEGTVDRSTSLALYRQHVRMRRFEKRAYDLFMQNLVKGTSHLSLGMEAVAAGFGEAMQPDDYTFATYRGHAHTLARGQLDDRGHGRAARAARTACCTARAARCTSPTSSAA